MKECACYKNSCLSRQDAIDNFPKARECCPAIRQILLTDEIWKDIKVTTENYTDEVCHKPHTFLAYQNGYLNLLTSPFHELFLEGDTLKPSITKHYLADLKETWILKTSSKDRYTAKRRFQGKLFEIIFIYWLKKNKWKIKNLEAYNGLYDAEALDSRNIEHTFEVKFLTTAPATFELNRQASLNQGVAVAAMPVYSNSDYLLYRTYEAAKKLKISKHKKIPVIILDEYNFNFKAQIEENWIDWKQPSYFLNEQDFIKFYDKKIKSDPDLEANTSLYINNMDEIWIFSTDGLSIERQKVIKL